MGISQGMALPLFVVFLAASVGCFLRNRAAGIVIFLAFVSLSARIGVHLHGEVGAFLFTPEMAFVALLAAVCLASGSVSHRRLEPGRRQLGLKVAVCCFGLWTLVCLLMDFNPISLRTFFIYVFFPMAYFFVLVSAVKGARQVEYIAAGLTAIVLVGSLYSLVRSPVGAGQRGGYYFGNPNRQALVINAVFPFLLYFYVRPKGRHQAVLTGLVLACAALLAAALLLTASRTGALVLVLALGLSWFCPAYRNGLTRWLVVLTAAYVFATALGLTPAFSKLTLWNRLEALPHQIDNPWEHSRWTMYMLALDMVGDNLAFGVGINRFAITVYQGGVHSVILDLLLSFGLLGCVAFLVVTFLGAACGWRAFRKAREPRLKMLSFAAFTSLVAIFASSLTGGVEFSDTVFVPFRHYCYWTVLGLLVVLGNVVEPPAPARSPARRRGVGVTWQAHPPIAE